MPTLSGLSTNFFPTPNEGFTTTISGPVDSSSDTEVPLNSVSGLTNGAIFTGLIDPGNAKERAFTGVIDTGGSQITSVVFTTGTNATHTTGATVVDYVTGTHVGAMTKGILIDHDQSGRHKNLTDANGNEWIKQTATASAVNEVTVANAATGNPPIISATGDNTNVGLTLKSKAAAAITLTPGAGGSIVLDGFNNGWLTNALPAVSSVTALGNRSYTVTFASTVASLLTPGMRLRATRTVAAPTQCTDLESGSSQYYNKTSPNKLTFTDDFVVSAWVKLESYVQCAVISRYNGTSGWELKIEANGQVSLTGFNAGAANYSQVVSYQSVSLGRWVHVAAQLDMSAFTATTTTSYVMIDGVDVPAFVGRGGTNPTALIQAGNLEVGGRNGGLLPFDGKLAQVAYYTAKVTQATILASIDRTLTGSETSLGSAYSFNNSITDLNTTTPNDLTAQGSAVATNADSPFSQDSTGTIGSYDYGIVTKVATTVATVQVPEGCALPTTGGITTVDMSPWKVPFGFPVSEDRWGLTSLFRTSSATTSNATYGAFQAGGWALVVPIGVWQVGWQASVGGTTTTIMYYGISSTALTGLTGAQGNAVTDFAAIQVLPAAAFGVSQVHISKRKAHTSAATYVFYTLGATTSHSVYGGDGLAEIFAEFALL